jgi:hypothetical protein
MRAFASFQPCFRAYENISLLWLSTVPFYPKLFRCGGHRLFFPDQGWRSSNAPKQQSKHATMSVASQQEPCLVCYSRALPQFCRRSRKLCKVVQTGLVATRVPQTMNGLHTLCDENESTWRLGQRPKKISLALSIGRYAWHLRTGPTIHINGISTVCEEAGYYILPPYFRSISTKVSLL